MLIIRIIIHENTADFVRDLSNRLRGMATVYSDDPTAQYEQPTVHAENYSGASDYLGFYEYGSIENCPFDALYDNNYISKEEYDDLCYNRANIQLIDNLNFTRRIKEDLKEASDEDLISMYGKDAPKNRNKASFFVPKFLRTHLLTFKTHWDVPGLDIHSIEYALFHINRMLQRNISFDEEFNVNVPESILQAARDSPPPRLRVLYEIIKVLTMSALAHVTIEYLGFVKYWDVPINNRKYIRLAEKGVITVEECRNIHYYIINLALAKDIPVMVKKIEKEIVNMSDEDLIYLYGKDALSFKEQKYYRWFVPRFASRSFIEFKDVYDIDTDTSSVVYALFHLNRESKTRSFKDLYDRFDALNVPYEHLGFVKYATLDNVPKIPKLTPLECKDMHYVNLNLELLNNKEEFLKRIESDITSVSDNHLKYLYGNAAVYRRKEYDFFIPRFRTSHSLTFKTHFEVDIDKTSTAYAMFHICRILNSCDVDDAADTIFGEVGFAPPERKFDVFYDYYATPSVFNIVYEIYDILCTHDTFYDKMLARCDYTLLDIVKNYHAEFFGDQIRGHVHIPYSFKFFHLSFTCSTSSAQLCKHLSVANTVTITENYDNIKKYGYVFTVLEASGLKYDDIVRIEIYTGRNVEDVLYAKEILEKYDALIYDLYQIMHTMETPVRFYVYNLQNMYVTGDVQKVFLKLKIPLDRKHIEHVDKLGVEQRFVEMYEYVAKLLTPDAIQEASNEMSASNAIPEAPSVPEAPAIPEASSVPEAPAIPVPEASSVNAVPVPEAPIVTAIPVPEAASNSVKPKGFDRRQMLYEKINRPIDVSPYDRNENIEDLPPLAEATRVARKLDTSTYFLSRFPELEGSVGNVGESELGGNGTGGFASGGLVESRGFGMGNGEFSRGLMESIGNFGSRGLGAGGNGFGTGNGELMGSGGNFGSGLGAGGNGFGSGNGEFSGLIGSGGAENGEFASGLGFGNGGPIPKIYINQERVDANITFNDPNLDNDYILNLIVKLVNVYVKEFIVKLNSLS